MNNIFWKYFLALEKDVKQLNNYIEFDKRNIECFSLQNARLLMTSTQEIDVILKEIIKIETGQLKRNEYEYRAYFYNSSSEVHSKLLNNKVRINNSNIELTPFKKWLENTTPIWWTANNKIKHERVEKFHLATLGNVLKSLSALFLLNVYYVQILESENKFIKPSNLVLSDSIKVTMMNGKGEFLFRYQL